MTQSNPKTNQALWQALVASPAASVAELAKASGLSLAGTKKILARLKAAGRIRRLGPKRGGCWEVAETAPAFAGYCPPGRLAELPPAETEALKSQVMQALDATFQGYVAAWERRDPEAEQLHQRQKQLTALAAQLRAQRLRQLGAEFGTQSAQFQTANAGLESSVGQLRNSVRKANRAVDIASRVDHLLVLVAKLAK